VAVQGDPRIHPVATDADGIDRIKDAARGMIDPDMHWLAQEHGLARARHVLPLAESDNQTALPLPRRDMFAAARTCHGLLNRPGFTGGQNSRRIARYGTDTKE
jgi:glycerate-2-kinase